MRVRILQKLGRNRKQERQIVSTRIFTNLESRFQQAQRRKRSSNKLKRPLKIPHAPNSKNPFKKINFRTQKMFKIFKKFSVISTQD